jgi:precorrin-2 dehydrogenase / sirohydrochlorin ferrochelatase
MVGEYQARHLDGAALVFAATDNAQVNAAVVADARERDILVNRADSDEGDFSIPAVFRDQAVTIAVWAGGSPAIAAKIRDGIQQTLDRKWAALAEAMKKLRPVILSANMPEEARRGLFRELAGEEAADLAVRGDVAALEARVKARIAGRGD